MRKDIFEVLIMEIRTNKKVNCSKIARQYNCDPRTVKRYLEHRGESPTERKKRKVVKVTDGFETIIAERYIEHNAPAVGIYQMLKEEHGYKGSYSSIKAYTHKLKEDKIKEVTIRFETVPGGQCQIDWKESLKMISKDGTLYVINIFLSILGYSRYKYIELTLDRTQATLFRCLSNAIRYFGGTPHEFLFDNMRTVVDRSRTQFDVPVYNEKFVEFSKDAGFIPRSCIAYRPRTKGKVEVVAKIMNRLKAYNHEFETLDELNKIVTNLMEQINSEIQQTTHEVPKERLKKEKEYLNPEPKYELLETYYSTKPITRLVPKDALITYQGKKYSVPSKYIKKTVNMDVIEGKLKIYYENHLICTHEIGSKSINYLPEHYKEQLSMVIKDKDNIDEFCKFNLGMFDNL